MELISAMMIGLVGSFHCVGMCGPIALALPNVNLNTAPFLAGRLLYNSGRIVTYALMGGLFGLLGKGIAIAGIQQWISILLGVLILVIVFLPSKIKINLTRHEIIERINSPLKKSIGILFKKGTAPSMFAIGFFNGFLPCGLVYVALAGAVASGSMLNGMLFMFLFGLGTLPLLFTVSLFGKILTVDIRQKIRRLIPVFAAALAIIFILRGLNLGIPIVSPKLTGKAPSTEMMHKH